jgi:drug/metabolite transporter (DMT)-like permease
MPDPQLTDAPARGIVCMIIGTMLLTSNDAISKWLLSSLHPGDVMAWRGLLSLPFIFVILRVEGGSVASFKSRAPQQSLLRAILALSSSTFVIITFQVLPLADGLALIFISPLLVTALSAILLAEPVGWRRWSATVVGFVGSLLIVGPSFDAIGLWVLAPLAAAVSAALRDIATRKLGAIDTGPSILLWTMLVAAVGGFASLPILGASPVSNEAWVLLVAAAAMLALSNRLTIAAYKLASGAVVAPLKYLSLIWAGGIGYVVWGDAPDAQKALGAAIVAAAGLYIWRREIILQARSRGYR